MEAGYRLRQAGDRSWEAVRDGEVVGRASEAGGELREVLVHPAHRRKGIGRCLARAVISDLLKAGTNTLLARASDPAGQAFLEDLGCSPLGPGLYGWTDLRSAGKCAR